MENENTAEFKTALNKLKSVLPEDSHSCLSNYNRDSFITSGIMEGEFYSITLIRYSEEYPSIVKLSHNTDNVPFIIDLIKSVLPLIDIVYLEPVTTYKEITV